MANMDNNILKYLYIYITTVMIKQKGLKIKGCMY